MGVHDERATLFGASLVPCRSPPQCRTFGPKLPSLPSPVDAAAWLPGCGSSGSCQAPFDRQPRPNGGLEHPLTPTPAAEPHPGSRPYTKIAFSTPRPRPSPPRSPPFSSIAAFWLDGSLCSWMHSILNPAFPNPVESCEAPSPPAAGFRRRRPRLDFLASFPRDLAPQPVPTTTSCTGTCPDEQTSTIKTASRGAAKPSRICVMVRRLIGHD